jgi:hypothetical protein
MENSQNSNKRKRRIPSDAQWCISNVDTLTPKSFFLFFHHTEKDLATRRYKLIIDKWIDASNRTRLVNGLKAWRKSEEMILFWREKAASSSSTDVETLVGVEGESGDTLNKEVSCNVQQQSRWFFKGEDVTDLFFKYRNRIVDIINNSKDGIFLENRVIEIIGHFHILFLAPGHFSDIQKSIFSEVLLNELHNKQIRSFMMKTLKPAVDVYLKLSHIVYDIEEKNISIMKGVLMLTQMADTLFSEIIRQTFEKIS